jgi:amino acid adenylation domain-containing protein/thioester reductase-like protein
VPRNASPIDPQQDIAVIGLEGVFPQANSVDELWDALVAESELISRFSNEELLAAGSPATLINNPDYVPARGVLQHPTVFDHAAFGFSPREAAALDPQHRWLLFCARAALTNAGIDASRTEHHIGIFASCSRSTYHDLFVAWDDELREDLGAFKVDGLNDRDSLATLVAYRLGLRGPAINIQSACSSSLVAVHYACLSLANGECDVALAGGSSVHFPTVDGYLYEQGGIMSPDGHCRPFDIDSKGTVDGSGAGIVVLRRLDDALRDGDPIRAVVRGTSVNSDGSRKVSMSAPSAVGQAFVIRDALHRARLEPGDIGYIETHGTATELGDMIEIDALKQVYSGVAPNSVGIGSIKSSIGHLDAAAGVAGFIKTVLTLERQKLPASLHFHSNNPRCGLDDSPFAVVATTRDWSRGPTPRRAAVSAFGVGGTNVHAVLEEAPSREQRRKLPNPAHLLIWSSGDAPSAKITGEALRGILTAAAPWRIADAAATLAAAGRSERYRQAAVIRRQSGSDPVWLPLGNPTIRKKRRVALVFPGQGTQRAGMAAAILEESTEFAKAYDACMQYLTASERMHLHDLLCNDTPENSAIITQTLWAQPTLFVTSYALAKALQASGADVVANVGHSIGELVSATLSGVMSLETAMAAVSARAAAMMAASPGAMLALDAAHEALNLVLATGVVPAAMNGPDQLIVAGTHEAIATAGKRCEELGISATFLRTSHAFHSPLMQDAAATFADFMAGQSLQPAASEVVSNLIGGWAPAETFADAGYWGRQIVSAVRFSDCIEAVVGRYPDVVLVSTGAETISSGLAAKLEAERPGGVRTVKFITAGRLDFFASLGRMWMAGADFDLCTLVQPGAQKAALPSRALPTIDCARPARSPHQGHDANRWHLSVPNWHWAEDEVPVSQGTTTLDLGTTDEFPRDPATVPKTIVVRLSASDCTNPIAAMSRAGRIIRSIEAISGVERLLFVARLNGDPRVPIQSGLAAYLKSAAAEYPNLRFRLLQIGDLDNDDEVIRASSSSEWLAENGHVLAATRNGSWRESCTELTPQQWSQEASLLCMGGTYLVTGAFGGLASSLVRRLAQKWRARFILVGRDNVTSRAKQLELEDELRASGQILSTYNADLANIDEVNGLIDKLRPQLDAVDGVFHAAGIPGGGLISLRPDAQMAKVCNIKLLFVNALLKEGATRQRRPFLVLYSSLAGLLGDLGQADYACANAALDALAHNGHVSFRIISLNLTAWKSVGMAARANVNTQLDIDGTDGALDVEDGLDAIEAALRTGQSRIAITRRDLGRIVQSRRRNDQPDQEPDAVIGNIDDTVSLTRWVASVMGDLLGTEFPSADTSFVDQGGDSLMMLQLRQRLSTTHANVPTPSELFALATPKAIAEALEGSRHHRTAQADTESSVVGVVCNAIGRLLSVEKVPEDSEFTDLGGDSLMAMNLVRRLNQRYGTTLTLREVFALQTPARIAAAIQAARQDPPSDMPKTTVLGTDDRPLTPDQQRLWVISKIGNGNVAYNLPSAFLLKGSVDEAALARAVNALGRRHPILLARIVETSAGPRQVVGAGAALSLSIEWQESGDAQQLANAEAARPFLLSLGPLARIRLVHLSAQHSLLLMTVHHIAADGPTVGLLLNDLALLYQMEKGEAVRLPIAGDYFKRGQAIVPTDARELAWWVDKVEPVVLNLPEDYPRPMEFGYRGSTLKVQISDALSTTVGEFARRQGVTESTVMLAAFIATLAHWSGDTSIIVGVPVTRRGPDDDQIAGMLVNTVVIQIHAPLAAGFANLVQNVQQEIIDALDHHDVDFGAVVEALRIRRDPARTPLYSAMFTYQREETSALDLGDTEASFLLSDSGAAKTDLTLSVERNGRGISAALEFNTEIWSSSTAHAFCDSLTSLLGRGIVDSDIELLRVTLFPDHAMREGLALGLGEPASVVSLSTMLVKGGCDFHFEGWTLEVEVRQLIANLQQELRARGIGRGTRVGVMSAHGYDAALAFLALVSIGAVYLPVSATDPVVRVTEILGAAGVRVLLQSPGLYFDIDGLDISVHCLRPNPQADQKIEMIVADIPDDATAAILHTSGSTGVPKGVIIPRHVIANLLSWEMSVEPQQRILQIAPPVFDMFMLEVLTAWLGRGALIVPDSRDRSDPIALSALAAQTSASTAMIPVPMLQTWAKASYSPDFFSGLKRIVVAGEQLIISDRLASWMLHRPDIALWNYYGPTETHVVTTHRVQRQELMIDRRIPIGRPIARARIALLDAIGRPVPPGLRGEIYIAGSCLSDGYLDTEQQGDRFKMLTLEEGRPTRFYRTGDLGLWNNDHTLQFLGRADQQLKVRGFRVEPAEVELAINDHPQVKGSLVILEGHEDNTTLVAYIQLEQHGPDLSRADFVDWLEPRLPEYMIPAKILVVPSIPKTVSGKINRQADVIDTVTGQLQATSADSRAPVEQVRSLMANLLARPELKPDEDFFSAGGNSLLLTKLMLMLRETFGHYIPFRDLIRRPTALGISNKLSGFDGAEIDHAANAAARDAAMPLSFGKWSGSSTTDLVLLTGATGSVGAGVLRQLVEQGREVAVLSRGAAPSFGSGIRHLFGDLEAPDCGLSKADQTFIHDNLGTVIHVAANVKHIMPYQLLANVNVAGTRELMKLAAAAKCRRFVLVSTLAAAPLGTSGMALEAPPPLSPNVNSNGYVMSKWAAERIAADAQELGAPVTVVRLGHVLGDSRTGMLNHELNHLNAILRASIANRCMPDFGNKPVHALPADLVAAGLVRASERDDIHWANLVWSEALRWYEIHDLLEQQVGKVDLLPTSGWARQVLASVRENDPLYALLSIYLGETASDDECEEIETSRASILLPNAQLDLRAWWHLNLEQLVAPFGRL